MASTARALGDALKVATRALAGPERDLGAGDLEVAVLSRSNGRRCFQRLSDEQVAVLLADAPAEPPA